MQSPRPSPLSSRSPSARRRGVTLLEMLVTVALLLVMMLTIVSIFQAATGSVTESRARAILDQDLRRIDTLLRQDLSGVTCKMTPPNDPGDNLGYFEYCENALSDEQGEDSDDTLRFTAKAPDGRPFTGRVWVPRTVPPPLTSAGVANPNADPSYASSRSVTLEPMSVTSQYAEIAYFQRGDKLYRRVRLVLPSFASKAVGNTATDPNAPMNTARTGTTAIGFATNLFQPFGLFKTESNFPAIQRTVSGVPFVSWQALNDISARPSRYRYPYDSSGNPTLAGYVPIPNSLGDLTDRHNRFASPRFADDFRNNTSGAFIPDGLPDDLNNDGVPDYYPTMYFNSKAARSLPLLPLLNDSFANSDSRRPLTRDIPAFPYIFPNAFSAGIQSNYGLIHAPDANTDTTKRTFNHNPVPVGDSLPTPSFPQTWWGFPTWRETASPTWLDPIKRINEPGSTPFYNDPNAGITGAVEAPYQQIRGLTVTGGTYALPPQPGPFSDGAGGNLYDLGDSPVFEDDLIATNVRSFNVKAFDPSPRYINSSTGNLVPLLPGYFDLGYISGINPTNNLGQFDARYASGALTVTGSDSNTSIPYSTIIATHPYLLDCFGHEGRIPPLIADYRFDPQYPYINNVKNNVGDSTTTVLRMRRVWDSWSTTYTAAPAQHMDPSTGPLSGFAPAIPSYPAPYPSALRGIEIQIRLTDPDDLRIKTMTIRQDFSEKL